MNAKITKINLSNVAYVELNDERPTRIGIESYQTWEDICEAYKNMGRYRLDDKNQVVYIKPHIAYGLHNGNMIMEFFETYYDANRKFQSLDFGDVSIIHSPEHQNNR